MLHPPGKNAWAETVIQNPLDIAVDPIPAVDLFVRVSF